MLPLLAIAAEKTEGLKTAVRRFSLWRLVEPFFEHLVYPFYRTSSKSSFGKLWASILLFTCLYFWIYLHQELPNTLETMVQTMLVYVFVTKPVQIARDHIERKSNQPTPSKSTKTPEEAP